MGSVWRLVLAFVLLLVPGRGFAQPEASPGGVPSQGVASPLGTLGGGPIGMSPGAPLGGQPGSIGGPPGLGQTGIGLNGTPGTPTGLGAQPPISTYSPFPGDINLQQEQEAGTAAPLLYGPPEEGSTVQPGALNGGTSGSTTKGSMPSGTSLPPMSGTAPPTTYP